MIVICKEYADPHSHQFVTVLIDSFGKKFIVQTGIIENDHAAEVEAAKTMMATNEQAYIAALKDKHNFSDRQIEALQKKPGDCGCQ